MPVRRTGLNTPDFAVIFGGLLLSLVGVGVPLVLFLEGVLQPTLANGREFALIVLVFTVLYCVGFGSVCLLGVLRGRQPQDFGLRQTSLAWMLVAVALGVVFIPIPLDDRAHRGVAHQPTPAGTTRRRDPCHL
ncbi:MAG: hypothetical protein HC915_11075 [Anaerolineae bacterium]|nr:hypothetical protein [Anaerolineae bacterium]